MWDDNTTGIGLWHLAIRLTASRDVVYHILFITVSLSLRAHTESNTSTFILEDCLFGNNPRIAKVQASNMRFP